MLRWPIRLQGYHDHGGNTFLPFIESGYQSIDLETVLEDLGENSPTGRSHLPVNLYFAQNPQDPNYRNIDNITWTFELAGENLDLKGGTLYSFVVVADSVPALYPSGNHQPPSSGRYWQRGKPLTAGVLPTFASNSWGVPSSSGWWGSFSRAGAVVNMPANPDLRCIEAIGVGVQDHTAQPTGILACRLIQLG